MLSLSPMKLLIIVAVVIILLGPDKLPEVANKVGSTWHSLRRFQQRVESEVRGALPELPSSGDIARFARSPLTALNHLADRAEGSLDEPSEPPVHFEAPGDVENAPALPTEPLSADPSLN